MRRRRPAAHPLEDPVFILMVFGLLVLVYVAIELGLLW